MFDSPLVKLEDFFYLCGMENEFVPYELALRMKQLGFVKPCVAFYEVFKGDVRDVYTISSEVCERLCSDEKFVKAPTFSQAFRWFREQKGMWVTFEYDDCDCVEADICWYVGKCFIYGIGPLFLTNELGDFKTLEEAELACLEKLLDIAEQKQK
jgi:hypothetical protein